MVRNTNGGSKAKSQLASIHPGGELCVRAFENREMLLHKRVPVGKTPEELFGKVRVPHDVAIVEGTGTAMQMTVVATGSHEVGKFAGIPVSTFGQGVSHDYGDFIQLPVTVPMRSRMKDTNGIRRKVYACFVINESELPVNFAVHEDIIYNTIDTVLEDVVERPQENTGYVGTFSSIKQLPWRFCCYLMKMEGGGDVPDIEFSDPDMLELLSVLYVCSDSVTFEDESEPYDELICAINGLCAQDTTLTELPGLLSKSTFQKLLDALSMHSDLVEFEDEAQVSSRLESVLRIAADTRGT